MKIKGKYKANQPAGLRAAIAGVLTASFFGTALGDEAGRAAPSGETVGVIAPVWTEELGAVSPDEYTLQERAEMVRKFWTPERMRNAIPAPMPSISEEDLQRMETPSPEDMARHEIPAVRLAEPVLPAVQRNRPLLPSAQ